MFQFLHRLFTAPEENFLQRELEAYGFEKLPIKTLHVCEEKLDREAMQLIGNSDAYYKNRQVAWSITSAIIRKENK